jgi:hypothetical protein
VATTSKELHENSLKVIASYFGRTLPSQTVLEMMNDCIRK